MTPVVGRLLAGVLCLGAACAAVPERVLTISGSMLGREGQVLRLQLERFRLAHPDLRVALRDTPDAADQRHQLYVQWLNARVGEPDVLQLDVVWTPEFAAAGWIHSLDEFHPSAGDFFETSRLGFANPRAEPRSNIERVRYELANGTLRRGRYAVLDRAAGSVPDWRELVDRVSAWRLRYLDSSGAWLDRWPPRDTPDEVLPRAVEFRLTLEDLGELRRVVALPSTFPSQGVGANGTIATSPAGELPLSPTGPGGVVP